MTLRARFAVVAALVWVMLVMLPAAAVMAQATGSISGTVYDASTGEPLSHAGVTVLETEQRTQTDDDGKFHLEIAPGVYSLRIASPTYTAANLGNIQVTAGGLADASASLNPTGAVIDVLEIVAEAHQAAEATQLLERKVAAYVSDNISAQLIKQSPDSSAAEIVTRLPAITVSNDDFIFIRGLGERYSSALLNGNRLPSTDPDKRVISLDLFPAEFIESLSIMKSYTPDLPGDFAGGLVDIKLKDFPEELTYSLGVSTAYNTESTFRDFQTYKGSNLDYLGFGEKDRALPKIFGDERLDENAIASDSRQRALHEALPNVWDVDQYTPGPNLGLKFNVGNRFGPFGFLLGANYSNEYQVYRNRTSNSVLSGDAFCNDGDSGCEGGLDKQQINFASYDESTFKARLSAVLTSGLEISEDHSLRFSGFFNRNASDLTKTGVANLANNLEGLDVFNTQFRYRVDQLGFGQLGGTHHVGPVDVDWRTALALTTRDEPDRRFIKTGRETGTDDPPALLNKDPSLVRLFNNLSEWMTDSAVDFSVPFDFSGFPLAGWEGEEGKLKSGFAYTYRDRSFEQRRFRIEQNFPDLVDTTQSIEDLLVPENIGGAAARAPFSFEEGIDKFDDFESTQEIAGGYGMVDVPILPETFRFIGGARVEYSLIETSTGIDAASGSVDTRIEDVDVMPGANFVYSPRDDMKVRFGISRTVSRPEFRELMPTQFPALDGETVTTGNPDLVSTNITSYDVRWEWFLSDAELVSFGVFKKDIPDAIERIAISGTSSRIASFANSTASLWGFEVELRKNFGFIGEAVRNRIGGGMWLYSLENFSLLTNMSLIRSTANIQQLSGEDICPPPPAESPILCRSVQTNSNRSLQGQADLVANAALQYDNVDWGNFRLLYNYVGESIASVGVDRALDILAAPTHTLDFVWTTTFSPFDVPLNTKLSVENMLNEDYEETQGPLQIDRYEPGVKFGVGVSYTF